MWRKVLPVAIVLLSLGHGSRAETDRVTILLDVKGPIGPAVADYVHRGLEKARKESTALVVLRMDTPGGLDTSMREIIQDILASAVPVATYVAPSGARAASAGTYILYASHVAAMAPGTTLGAATPVAIGGPPSFPGGEQPKPDREPGTKDGEKAPAKAHPTMADKAVSDAIAYIRGLAQLRGRNVEWAEKAVSEAASLPAADALAARVVDVIADDVDALLAGIDGRTVAVGGGEWTLKTKGLQVVAVEPDWRTRFLAVITNPSVAYVLMLVGIYGLILEFYNPGMFLPGTVGAISLVLALYALHLLPVNYAGLALVVLGLALMIAEAFTPSFGVLGIGGVAGFVIGSVMLLDIDVPGFAISWTLIGAIALVASSLLLLVMTMLVRSRGRAVVSGPEEMVGSTGPVIDWSGATGRVRVHGEVWKARAATALQPGHEVRVAGIDGLTLIVEPEPKPGKPQP